MEVKACPNCGSRKIYQGRMGDGVLTGYTSREVCRNCGYQGMSIIFDSEQEYKKFLESKKLNKDIKEDEKKTKKIIEK
jgi:RNA polymerase subunit RPABC4/transcription elongation factor Spt4